MTKKPPEGAIVGRRIRGPLNSLDAAMQSADRMLAEVRELAPPLAILAAMLLLGAALP